MNFKILAYTTPNYPVSENDFDINKVRANNENFDLGTTFKKFSGEMAGICYMPHDINALMAQPDEKKFARANTTMANGHTSVFDHEFVTLYLEDVPKLFAMLLNNEKQYTTSEKSARYTKMEMQGKELDLYTKWSEKLVGLISEKYGNEPYFDERRIQKLAQENARYFLSVYTPTSLAYTTSFRQLNNLYAWLNKIDQNDSVYLQKLKPTAMSFCKFLQDNGLINKPMVDYANLRNFSLIAPKDRVEYFGDVYCISYTGSFAQLAQAQRHRTIAYEMKPLDTDMYYVPKIIRENPKLKSEWLNDMYSIKEVVPQGQMVQIYERGTPENFVMKLRERLCTCAQLEICDQTKENLQKYITNTKDEKIKEMLNYYNKGARCTSGYKCNSPCNFKDGITLKRTI